jgi:hypothetical protein
MKEMKEKVEDQLRAKAVNDTISCAVARALAEEIGISYKEIGAAADGLGIKIKECQLGCF